MTYAARVAGGAFPVAELLGYDLAERTGHGLVLTTRVPGTSVIPPGPEPERLRALGAVAALISSIQLTPAPPLPVRSRPIDADDFAGMRRAQGASKPPSTSCAAGRPRPAGLRSTFPTGTPSRRSPPRRTWAGSRYRWPLRGAPT
jgi:hypothetical protein